MYRDLTQVSHNPSFHFFSLHTTRLSVDETGAGILYSLLHAQQWSDYIILIVKSDLRNPLIILLFRELFL